MAQRAMCHPSFRTPFEVVGDGKLEAKPVSDSDTATESKAATPSGDKAASGKSKKKGKKKVTE